MIVIDKPVTFMVNDLWGNDQRVGVSFMQKTSKTSQLDTSSSKTVPTDTSTGFEFQSIATTMVAAQFEYVKLVSQYSLMWASLPAQLMAAASTSRPRRRSQDVTAPKAVATPAVDRSARIAEISWLSAPTISGVEETLNDQFFKPRPREANENDLVALWRRSNEFDADHAFAGKTGGRADPIHPA
jgi:hypothetical protein